MSRKITPQDHVIINGEEIPVSMIMRELKHWMDNNFVCTVGTINMIGDGDVCDLMKFPKMNLEEMKKAGFKGTDAVLYTAFAMGFNAGMQTERKEMMGKYLSENKEI